MAGRDTKLPKFALIKQYVQGQIESADWPVGTCIPSETELATTFNVSRMTARRALQELADQGLLSRVPGRGSFVAKPEAPAPIQLAAQGILALRLSLRRDFRPN